MLETDGTTALVAGLDVVKGEGTGKVALNVAAGRVGLKALFGIKLGSVVSGVSPLDGAGGSIAGKVEAGKPMDAGSRELVVPGTRGKG